MTTNILLSMFVLFLSFGIGSEDNPLFAQTNLITPFLNFDFSKMGKEAETENNIEDLLMIARTTPCPSDKYNGDDKENIKTKIKSEFAFLQEQLKESFSFNLLEVYFPGGTWDRKNWDEWADYSKIHHDESALNVAIVVQPKKNPNPEIAYIIYYNLIKNHNHSDKINYICFYCNNGKSEPEVVPILIKKIN